MHETIAEDLMIPLDKYPHINYSKPVREAISLFFHTKLVINGRSSLTRALLVFDDENKLVGMVRRRDIMQCFDPKCFFGHCAHHPKMLYGIKDDPELLEISFERLKNNIINNADKPVGEVMIKVTHTVNYNDHMLKIIYEMCDQRYSLLPVMKDSEVVGVIRTVEVMDEIRKILEIE
jgi:predicted transcriptional regulator